MSYSHNQYYCTKPIDKFMKIIKKLKVAITKQEWVVMGAEGGGE